MSRPRTKGRDGFSLLEIFFALLILSIGVIGLAMVQMSAITAGIPHYGSEARVATGLAQAALDRFDAMPWSAIRSSHPEAFRDDPKGAVPDYARLPVSAGDFVVVRGTTYYRVWRVTLDPETPTLKTISVWCCWKRGEGPWRRTVLVTQRADAAY